MKICKKLLAFLIAASMLLVCTGALAAYEPHDPEVPEGYDGYVTFAVSAITMGWAYIIDPVLVPVHEGENFAAVTIRALEMLNWGCSYYGSAEGGFYLDGIACYETEPMVPDYLMEQILAYPDWSDDLFGEHYGEWTGAYTDDEMLTAGEYCTLSGWMFSENNVDPGVGADGLTVTPGCCYTWFFTVYGWGMDYGVSDGWGMFPAFDNPMAGVDRTEASIALAQLCADEEMEDVVLDIAPEEFIDLLVAFYDPESTQELIDETLAALLEALDSGGEYEIGDVNMDGKMDANDALYVMRASMSLVELSEEEAALADFNGDGVVNMNDALLIMRTVMNVA